MEEQNRGGQFEKLVGSMKSTPDSGRGMLGKVNTETVSPQQLGRDALKEAQNSKQVPGTTGSGLRSRV